MSAPPLYKLIYDHIIEEIRSSRLAPGDRVPSEKELADEFKVSRITSKKALDLLAQDRVIERIQGKGSFISSFGATALEAKAEAAEPVEDSLIGLIIPNFEDSYSNEIIRSIEFAARKHRSHLIIKLSHDNSVEEEAAIQELVEQHVNGLIIYPINGRHYNQKILELVINHYPLVLIDRYLRGIPASSVCTDNKLATMEATKYLFDRGHERIAFISKPGEGTSAIEERIQGFHMAYSQKAIQSDPQLFLTNVHMDKPEETVRNIQSFVIDNPGITAFFASEYNVAVILRYALEAIGKTVPDDYSVICFDSPSCIVGKPFFTHIKQDETAIGTLAMEFLAEQWNGNKAPKNTFTDFTLIEGSSVKPARMHR
jgi:GntR family transcriptional regulator, arabinose operon transcriptional repressor